MSINSEVTRLTNAKSTLKASIEAKGVPVANNLTLESYASKVDAIVVPDVTVYTGSSTPSSSLGQNGDIYIKI